MSVARPEELLERRVVAHFEERRLAVHEVMERDPRVLRARSLQEPYCAQAVSHPRRFACLCVQDATARIGVAGNALESRQGEMSACLLRPALLLGDSAQVRVQARRVPRKSRNSQIRLRGRTRFTQLAGCEQGLDQLRTIAFAFTKPPVDRHALRQDFEAGVLVAVCKQLHSRDEAATS